ncbi:hypothetical protein A3709_19615 [Halioglobus sp. HI00S01]|uniref:hypothetical protein n=1 Tax=Halioglobus sp. HI00S01 TaxID=1822214 RepID=UPI0007C2E28F|nr:hypothetical protein [Halioglobus sp. HI00S01]KZX57834.1 hypothetical protein A3709_19615 [Halioglobus sp. HI00S01]
MKLENGCSGTILSRKALLMFCWILMFIIQPASAQRCSEVGCGNITIQQQEMILELKRNLRLRAQDVAEPYQTDVDFSYIDDCLSRLRSIDTSILTFDLSGLIAGAIERIKDEILDFACTAATDWVNDQTRQLNNLLQRPSNIVEQYLLDLNINAQDYIDRVPVQPLPPSVLENRAGPSPYESVDPTPQAGDIGASQPLQQTGGPGDFADDQPVTPKPGMFRGISNYFEPGNSGTERDAEADGDTP